MIFTCIIKKMSIKLFYSGDLAVQRLFHREHTHIYVSLRLLVQPSCRLARHSGNSLLTLCLNCASETSPFEGPCSPNTSPYPSISTTIGTAPPLDVNVRNGGVELSVREKGEMGLGLSFLFVKCVSGV